MHWKFTGRDWLVKFAKQSSNTFRMSHCLSNSYQNVPPLPIPFYDHLEYTAKWIKITKKPRKPINSSFLPCHIGFYETVWKSTAFFSITILLQFLKYHDVKVKCFALLHEWKILPSRFPWYIHDLSNIQIYLMAYLASGNYLWKYLNVYFQTLLKYCNSSHQL